MVSFGFEPEVNNKVQTLSLAGSPLKFYHQAFRHPIWFSQPQGRPFSTIFLFSFFLSSKNVNKKTLNTTMINTNFINSKMRVVQTMTSNILPFTQRNFILNISFRDKYMHIMTCKQLNLSFIGSITICIINLMTPRGEKCTPASLLFSSLNFRINSLKTYPIPKLLRAGSISPFDFTISCGLRFFQLDSSFSIRLYVIPASWMVSSWFLILNLLFIS